MVAGGVNDVAEADVERAVVEQDGFENVFGLSNALDDFASKLEDALLRLDAVDSLASCASARAAPGAVPAPAAPAAPAADTTRAAQKN